MSMYRQLWFAVAISTLLALGGSLLASTLAARSYLSQQLTLKNADNATALALALSQKQPDAVDIELAAAALFDSGNYELIRVTDPEGKLIVERIADGGDLGAPEWFMRRFPITASPGEAQISSGWKQVGVVRLVSHSRFAYRALWESTLDMIVALALAGALGGYLGSLVLRRLKRPLDAVIVIFCSRPVPTSFAETLTMPLASISNVTSTCGTPRGAGGIPTRWNLPRVLLSAAIGRSP